MCIFNVSANQEAISQLGVLLNANESEKKRGVDHLFAFSKETVGLGNCSPGGIEGCHTHTKKATVHCDLWRNQYQPLIRVFNAGNIDRQTEWNFTEIFK